MVKLRDLGWSVRVHRLDLVDQTEHNVDVFVHFEDGSRYVATFFTLANIHWLFEKNRVTGESADGTYLWASDMILVREYSMPVLEATIRDLLADGSFERAFARCETDEDPS